MSWINKAFLLKGLKKLIFIHNIRDSKGHKPEFEKTSTLEDLGTDLLALIDSNTNKPTSGPVRDGPTRSRPPVFIPATPTNERAEKKGPLHDDTQSLTELEKQAEQEVDSIANKKKGKVKNIVSLASHFSLLWPIQLNCLFFLYS